MRYIISSQKFSPILNLNKFPLQNVSSSVGSSVTALRQIVTKCYQYLGRANLITHHKAEEVGFVLMPTCTFIQSVHGPGPKL